MKNQQQQQQQQQTNNQTLLRSLLEANSTVLSSLDDEDMVFPQSDVERRESENSVLDKDHILSILDEALDILHEDDFAPTTTSPSHFNNTVSNGTTRQQ